MLSGPPSGVLTAVVDDVGAGVLDLGDDGAEVLGVGVDVVGADHLAAELLELFGEGAETGAVGLLVVDDEGLGLLGLVVDVLGGEGALDGVRGGRTEVRLVGPLLGATVPLRALGEGRVGVGRSETSTSLASSKTFCIDSATDELSGPTTPRTSGSETNLVAFCWPEDGCAWSSRASNLKVTPGTYFFALACWTARSTEFLMPRPSAERSPVSGASIPMTTVVLPPSVVPPLLSSREPQAVSASVPTVSAAVMAMSER